MSFASPSQRRTGRGARAGLMRALLRAVVSGCAFTAVASAVPSDGALTAPGVHSRVEVQPDAPSAIDECVITSEDLVRAAGTPAGVEREFQLGAFGTIRASQRAETAYVWEGSFVGDSAAVTGTVLQMRTSAGVVAALHFADGSSIQAIPLGDGTTRIIRSAGQLPGCGGALAPPSIGGDARAGAQDGTNEGSLAGSCDDGSVIDVLVMWTPRAQSQSGGAAAARAIAEASVAITNHVYATSMVNVRMRAVGYSLTEPYTRDATANVIYDLTDTDDGFLDSVHTQRNALGADLVTLITGENLSYCGIAWIAGDDSPEYGFSVTVWNCALGNLTFTHEVGHNQGCCHAPGDGGGCTTGGIFSYSVGRRFTGTSGTQWRTVMAYAPGTRVPRFSSPLVIHDGVPTGTTGASGADNARTINETAAVMANYRCSVVPDTGAQAWIDSGLLVPPSGGASVTVQVTDAYAAADGTEVEITLAARADHDAASETLSLTINGVAFGTPIGGTGENCAMAARTTVVSAAAFNAALLAAAPAQCTITSSAAVDACSPPGEMRLSIRYVAATSSTACDTTVLFYADQDGDGYTLATGAHFCPGTTNAGYRPMRSPQLDCDDASASAYPGAPELCATVGTDNDCDGSATDIDANAADRVTYFADGDGDGYTLATGALFCPGTTNAGFRAQASSPLDCNDSSASVYPGAPELCGTVGTDNDCDGSSTDIDADAADRAPFYSDSDNDGFTLSTGALFCPGTTNAGYRAQMSAPLDCNDSSPVIYPGAPELCGTVGTDNDCDGSSTDIDATAADRVLFYRDQDNDSYTLSTGARFCPGTTNAGYRAQRSNPLDCNDSSASVYPGAPELCGTVGTDNDCDGSSTDIDADAADRATFYPDQDGDGYTLTTEFLACPGTAGAGYVTQRSPADDCDDTDPDIYPLAVEACDTIGIDNDCDGDLYDAAGAQTFWRDDDGDGFGSEPTTLPSCEPPSGFVSTPGDCNDSSSAAYPHAPELCSTVGTDNDCDGDTSEIDPDAADRVSFFADSDGDGFTLATGALFCAGTTNAGYRAEVSAPLDCDDTSPASFPSAPELCATVGTDNDCDGDTSETDPDAADRVTFYADADGDGYTLATGAPFCAGTTNAGYRAQVSAPLDCDDTSPSAFPGAPELCATVGTDNDCDGDTADTDADAADRVAFFADSDGDGYTLATGAPFCAGTTNSGYRAQVSAPLDCDDTSPSTFPGAPELCGTVGTDNDCDGDTADTDADAADRVTFFADSDGDGYTLATGAPFCAGTTNAGYRAQVSAPLDCDDTSASVFPGAPETCATVGTDNNCDGDASDATDPAIWYADSDGDGYGDPAVTQESCSQPAGFVAVAGDQCPANGSLVAPVAYFIDGDGDTYGSSATASFCTTTAPAGHSSRDGDCNDTSAATYPGAPELCATIGTDNDCDGDAQDATNPAIWYADADGDGRGDDLVTVMACTAPPGYVAIGGDGCPANPFAQAPILWYRDADGDMFGNPNQSQLSCSQPPGHIPIGLDCDDTRAWVNPAGQERCDPANIDEDCDGLADDQDPSATGQTIWYADADADGFGAGPAVSACDAPSSSHVTLAGDCDDTSTATYPGAPELCATLGTDNDCDGDTHDATDQVTWYADADGDGYGDDALTQQSCTQPAGYVAMAGDLCPELGTLIAPVAYFIDADGDSFGSATTAAFCAEEPPSGYSSAGGDCDDASATAYPGAPELCATLGTDNDCDGDTSDATDQVTWYADADGDGYGDSEIQLTACTAPGEEWSATAGDNCISIFNPDQADCNTDAVGDACDIAGGAADCDFNGVPDECQIAAGGDADGDGTLDSCQGDCNLNGLPDSLDIAQGNSTDCNGNGIPDDCEDGTIHSDTGNLGIPRAGVPLTATVAGHVPARTTVLVRIEVRGDLDAADEYVSLSLNGIMVTPDAFADTGESCASTPQVRVISLSTVDWLQVLDAAAAPGDVSLELASSDAVDSSSCTAAFARVTISYGGTSYDCDGDGYSDICQFDPATDDCDGNGIFDACEAGGPGDSDADGIPDSCEQDRGDYNLDGVIDGVDLSALLTFWGAQDPPFGDIVPDGYVDGKDLATLLAMWGPIP